MADQSLMSPRRWYQFRSWYQPRGRYQPHVRYQPHPRYHSAPGVTPPPVASTRSTQNDEDNAPVIVSTPEVYMRVLVLKRRNQFGKSLIPDMRTAIFSRYLEHYWEQISLTRQTS